jgi:lysophospholipase L1-like esterase
MNLLASLLFNQFATRHLLVSGLPPMHAFPALPEPLRSFLGDRARTFDDALAAWAGKRPNVEHLPFRTGSPQLDVAADGFHPGAAVYAQWGRAAAQRLLVHAQQRMGGIQAAASTPTNIR